MAVSATQHSLATTELDYDLPEGRIATRPAEPRDSARMMVVRRSRGEVEHAHVRDLPRFLEPGDALVFNNTAVAPARLVGYRESTGGKVEGLFVHEESAEDNRLRWRVMLHAGGKLRVGERIVLIAEHLPTVCIIELRERLDGEWIVHVLGSEPTSAALDHVGRTPLPPYILKARGHAVIEDGLDRDWYQTVYADLHQQKSVAAPTAGLHFTDELLNALHERGIERIDVTLHVGPGTFKPVTAATLAEHHMHSEEFEVSAEAIRAICRLRRERTRGGGGRILAVGTTTVRTLESLDWPTFTSVPECDGLSSIRRSTDLMIAPPFEFSCVDGMLTNFHLPRSTLLALVGAMVGLDRLKSLYGTAVDMGYRFYSYGDAMLILP